MAEGMDEQQGNVWTLSMPISAAVHESFLEVINNHDFRENFCILANRVHAPPSVNTQNTVVVCEVAFEKILSTQQS